LGRDFIQRVVGSKWQRVEQTIGQAGIMGVATMRFLPIAPFTIVTLISGAFQVRFRTTSLDLFSGWRRELSLLYLFAHQFESAIRNPGLGSYWVVIALVAITILGTLWLRRKLGNEPKKEIAFSR
jgi:uncharacterized membrane protein YdjX (TVP38/TMEM64 family)